MIESIFENELFWFFANNSSLALSIIGNDGRYQYVNKNFTLVFGYSLDEISTGNVWFAKAFPDKRYREQVISTWKNDLINIKIGHPIVRDFFVKCKDGADKHIKFTLTTMKNGNQIIIYEDRIVLERSFQDHKEKEEELRVFFDYAPDAYYIHDFAGNFIDGNIEAEKMIGYKKSELIGKNFFTLNLLPENEIEKAAINLEKNAEGNPSGPDEFTLIRSDGNTIEIEVRTYPIQKSGKNLVLGIARDITARKKLERDLEKAQKNLEKRVDEKTKELQVLTQKLAEEMKEKKKHEKVFFKSREKLKELIDSMNDGLIEIDDSLKIVFVNKPFCQIMNCCQEDILGCSFEEISNSMNNQKLKNIIKKKEDKFSSFEHELLRNDGKIIHCNIKINRYRTSIGQFFGGLLIIADLKKMEDIEKSLEDGTMRYRVLCENLPGMIYIGYLNWETVIIHGSSSICGYEAWEINEKEHNWLSIIHPGDKNRVYEEGTELRQKPQKIVQTYRILTKQGSIKWVEDHKKSIFSKEGKCICVEGILFDVTERKCLSEQLEEEKAKLEKTFAKIKTLSGLLPICTHCKKIRDDEGYWKQIELYIEKHSNAKFTHSICPECAKALYPDFDIY